MFPATRGAILCAFMSVSVISHVAYSRLWESIELNIGAILLRHL